MQQIEAVEASKAAWELVASYVLTTCQKHDSTPIYSYLRVAADLAEPTRKLVAQMNCDDSFTVLVATDSFPACAPPPIHLASANASACVPGPISMATGPILAVLGMRRLNW